MPQEERFEETLHEVMTELVRLLVVLDEHPGAVSTGHLEYLSRRLSRYSVPLSSAVMDSVACVENLAVALADLHEKLLVNTGYSCPPWWDPCEGDEP
jgi:hypothetical protein